MNSKYPEIENIAMFSFLYLYVILSDIYNNSVSSHKSVCNNNQLL